MFRQTFRKVLIGLVVLALVSSGGCGAGRPYVGDLSARMITPPSVMVAHTLPRTLYIVISPQRVMDAIAIRNSRHSVTGVRSFVGHGVGRALSPYFQDVRVVDAVPTDVQGPYFLADVRVDEIEARNLDVGQYIYTVLRMQWAFAIRPSEATEYTFTYAGDGVSEPSYERLEIGCEQMLLSAVSRMMTRWTEAHVHDELAAAGSPAAATPAESTPPAAPQANAPAQGSPAAPRTRNRGNR